MELEGLVAVDNSNIIRTVHMCPMCNKLRLTFPKGTDFDLDEEIEIETPRKKKITIPKNRCGFCDTKILNKYFKPTKTDIKNVVKTMADEDISLEDAL